MAIAVLVAYRMGRPRDGGSERLYRTIIALVLTGLGMSLFHLSLVALAHIELEPELIHATFMPGLLFEAGYHID
jgi:hypothetical protein